MSTQPKQVGPFIRRLGEGARRRLWLLRDRKKILNYMVELEVEVAPGSWKPVVRYDTRHGGPHCDQHRIDGQKRKEPLSDSFDINTGYKDAVAKAFKDIERHWADYRKRFLEGKWPR